MRDSFILMAQKGASVIWGKAPRSNALKAIRKNGAIVSSHLQERGARYRK